MAEGLLQAKLEPHWQDEVTVQSAGTLGLEDQPATRNAIAAAKEFGADISEHRSQGLTDELVENSDIIFCMAESHRDYLHRHFPAYRDNVFLLRDFAAKEKMDDPDIFDPIGSSYGMYKECCRIINSELDRILSYLVDLIEQQRKKS